MSDTVYVVTRDGVPVAVRASLPGAMSAVPAPRSDETHMKSRGYGNMWIVSYADGHPNDDGTEWRIWRLNVDGYRLEFDGYRLEPSPR